MTPEELTGFEDEMAEAFAAGLIKAPLHLGGGNERHLIDIFRSVGPEDWILGSWRAHYHCLLKGVPRSELREAILDGRSIALTFRKYKVLCSAIVAGIAPIAVGLAWGIKERGAAESVWCFLGDMSSRCGVVREAMQYGARFHLPIRWITEDNQIGGTNVPTEATWGRPNGMPHSEGYRYEMTRPFVGVGKHIPL